MSKKLCSVWSYEAISKAFQVPWCSSGCVCRVKRAFPSRRDFTTELLFAVACCILDFLLLPFGVSKTLWRWPQSISPWWRLSDIGHFWRRRWYPMWDVTSWKAVRFESLSTAQSCPLPLVNNCIGRKVLLHGHLVTFHLGTRARLDSAGTCLYREKMESCIKRIIVTGYSRYSFLQGIWCSRWDAICVGEAKIQFWRSRHSLFSWCTLPPNANACHRLLVGGYLQPEGKKVHWGGCCFLAAGCKLCLC